jgi:hypothetical protein
MSFPDAGALSNAERTRLDPRESSHHEDCPQHPWNDVFDETDPCECAELRKADAAEAADQKRAAEKEEAK